MEWLSKETLIRQMKNSWLSMFEPPWRLWQPATTVEELEGCGFGGWLLGWAWALAGLVGGAFFAPLLVQWAGLSHTSYQDWLVIGIAVLASVVTQVLSMSLLLLVAVGLALFIDATTTVLVMHDFLESVAISSMAVMFFIASLLPIAAVGYGIYRYLSWVGAGQRTVTIAFVGALLIKTFAIPLIKGIATGALFRWLMKWLRGGKDTKKAT